MPRAQIVTRWVEKTLGGEVFRSWKVFDDFPGQLLAWRDVTDTPAANVVPDPNAVVVEVTLSQAALDQIAAHPDYGDEAVLWSEDA